MVRIYGLTLIGLTLAFLIACSSDLGCGDSSVNQALKERWLTYHDNYDYPEFKKLAPKAHELFTNMYRLSLDSRESSRTENKIECSANIGISVNEDKFSELKKLADTETINSSANQSLIRASIDKLRAQLEASRMFLYRLRKMNNDWHLDWLGNSISLKR